MRVPQIGDVIKIINPVWDKKAGAVVCMTFDARVERMDEEDPLKVDLAIVTEGSEPWPVMNLLPQSSDARVEGWFWP